METNLCNHHFFFATMKNIAIPTKVGAITLNIFPYYRALNKFLVFIPTIRLKEVMKKMRQILVELKNKYI
jgi:hypothetical protein